MKYSFQLLGQHQRLLRCNLFTPKQQRKHGILIIAHGYKGFKDWGMIPYVADQLAQRSGLLTFTFNFTYNGVGEALDRFDEPEYFAINTYEREQADLYTVLHWLTSMACRAWLREVAPEQSIHPDMAVYLLGHSRGGANCLLYALDHPNEIAGVITWNGATQLDLFTEKQKHEMRTYGRSTVVNARTGEQLPLDRVLLEDLENNRERYNLIHRSAGATFPIVLIQGSGDFPHLREGSKRLIANCPVAEWVTIPGGGHTFQTVHPFQGTTPPLEMALTTTSNWLQQQTRLQV